MPAPGRSVYSAKHPDRTSQTMHPTDLPHHPVAGDPGAPGFIQRTPSNPRYAFDSAAGRYLVAVLPRQRRGSAGGARPSMRRWRGPTSSTTTAPAFFAVSHDPQDEALGRIGNRIPGIRVVWDDDRSVAGRYGATGAGHSDTDSAEASWQGIARAWYVIDPTMRVIGRIPFRADGRDRAEVLALLDRLPPPETFAGFAVQAPVLILPRVLEPELCRTLIAIYEREGGQESGFMRQIDGRTVGVMDPGFKVRRDVIRVG